jgi:hypothetical protein
MGTGEKQILRYNAQDDRVRFSGCDTVSLGERIIKYSGCARDGRESCLLNYVVKKLNGNQP